MRSESQHSQLPFDILFNTDRVTLIDVMCLYAAGLLHNFAALIQEHILEVLHCSSQSSIQQ